MAARLNDEQIRLDILNVDRERVYFADLRHGSELNHRATGLPKVLGRPWRTLNEKLNKAIPPEPIRSALIPPLTFQEWIEFTLIRIPIIRWVLNYRASFFLGDIISGITVAVMHIPQGLAYAQLANLDPVYGLYTSFVPAIIYSLLGSSRHISVGTFSVVQLMIGNAIDRVLATDSKLEPCLYMDGSNLTDISEMASGMMNSSSTAIDCSAEKISIAVTIALVCGLIMLTLGIAQCGFITIFLSESLISGFTTGAVCHVFTSQLTYILEINNRVPHGVLRLPKIWIKTFSNLPKANWATLLIFIIAFSVIIIFQVVNKYIIQRLHVTLPCYLKSEKKWEKKRFKWSVPIPSQLIVIIVACLISHYAEFDDRFSVEIVGDIPQGAPKLSNPFTGYIGTVITDSFAISIITYCVAVSMAQFFAKSYDYSIYPNQEFIAYGAMNIVGSFFSCFTAATGFSRAMVQATIGSKTQLVGLVSSAIILVVLLWLGPLLSSLPRAILAAIVCTALLGMLKQLKDLWIYYNISFNDMLIWLVSFFATLFLGIDLGLGVGVAFSFITLFFRTILPPSSVLGQAKMAENDPTTFQVKTIPGILIFRFLAPICFVNAAVFRKRLEIVSDVHNRPKKGDPEEKSCLQSLLLPRDKQVKRKAEVTSCVDKGNNGSSQEHRSIRLHTIIIDFAPVPFVDAVGMKTIKQITLDFKKHDVQVLFAAMTQSNEDMFTRANFPDTGGKKWLFSSIQDAILFTQIDSSNPGQSVEEVPESGIMHKQESGNTEEETKSAYAHNILYRTTRL